VSVVLAPVRALVRPPEGSGDAALFLFDGGRAKRVPVQAGRERGDEVEVRGVPPGAEVIVEGHEELKDGTPVALAAAPRGGAR
jgi:multidrug efflux pump subunit AcrA (membrane-fusion protein)